MSTEDPIERACKLHDLASELRAAGKPTEALGAAKEAADLFAKHDGPDSADVANALTVVSGAAHDLGHYDEALSAAERAWAILAPLEDEGNVDLDRLKLLAISANGQAHIARGEYARAGEVHERALPIGKRLGGADYAGVLNNLGMVCKYTARFEEGEQLYLEALGILEGIHGKDSAALCALLHNIGGLEHTRGRFEEGVPYARRGYDIRVKALGNDHPDVAADAAALAALLDGAGEQAEAKKLYQQALATYERVYGPKHFEVGFNLANLAALEHGLGNLEEANRLYTKALAIEEEALGKHPYVALTLHNIGMLKLDEGDAAGAKTFLERSLAMYVDTLGPAHPDAIAAEKALKSAVPPTKKKKRATSAKKRRKT